MTFPTPSSPAGLGSPLSSEQSTDRPQPQAGASPASRLSRFKSNIECYCCGQALKDHCRIHLIPCCPGKCSVCERPIIFSGAMVRAILAGRKTQTRRVCKQGIDMDGSKAFAVCPAAESGWIAWFGKPRSDIEAFTEEAYAHGFPCPYGAPGDRLWVRETWKDNIPPSGWIYRATDEVGLDPRDERPWRPSIFMPRWASRLTLEIVSVRVERLQSITAEDCIAEGIDYEKHRCGCERCAMMSQICPATQSSLIEAYAHLWDSINAKRGYGWDKNPWVWVIEFRRAE